MSYKETINNEKLPQHVAIIMDGNGRWAKERKLDRYRGHLEGVESVRAITEAATDLGLGFLTLYTFSTENWNRPQEEVDALMALFVTQIESETPTFIKNNIRLKVIGDLSRLPKEVLDKIEKCMERTSHHTGLTLQLALSYSARWEITNATREIAKKVEQKQLTIEAITEDVFSQHLTTAGIPDPDILIRTGKEMRVSNYLLWQISYAELFFPDFYWPDFKKEEFYQIISEYQNRERRFGKISEQL